MKTNWIFLRGWGRDSRHWGNFINEFKKYFNNVNIHLIDVPGTGKYSSDNCPVSVSAIVEQMATRWKKNHPFQSAHVIALSFGGMLAIDWMTRYPEMIDSVVLMNISSRDLSPFYQRLRYQTYSDILILLFSRPVKRELKIIELTSNLYPFRKELSASWAEYFMTNPISKMNLIRQLWAAAHST